MDKPNLVLDLDNTLLSAVPVEEIKWTDENRNLACEFPFYNMEDYYLVFERPGLQQFLDYIFQNFNVAIWSAASKDYVLFIVDKIIKKKPGRKLEFILFSNHCDECKKTKRGSIKLLDFLCDRYKLGNFSKENTFIIDDNDIVIKHNPTNSIHIKEFEFEDGPVCKEDRELLHLIPHMDRIVQGYRESRMVDPETLYQASSVQKGPLDKFRKKGSKKAYHIGSTPSTPYTPSQDDSSKAPTPPHTQSQKRESTEDTEGSNDGVTVDLLQRFDTADEVEDHHKEDDHHESLASPSPIDDSKVAPE